MLVGAICAALGLAVVITLWLFYQVFRDGPLP
jgi:hypothetical protein